MSRKKILFNAACIAVGGGVQATRTFVEHIREYPPETADFVFVLPETVSSQLDFGLLEGLVVETIDASPAGLLSGRAARRAIKEIENRHQPDLVYSLGFPSYVSFDAPEVGRYTNPWEIFSLNEAWSQLSFAEKAKRHAKTMYRLAWARRAAYFETQTEEAASAIVSRLGVPARHVFVSPNTVNPIFLAANKDEIPDADREEMFCFAAGHKHKNLAIIPRVALALRSCLKKNFRFVVTLKKADWLPIEAEAHALGVHQHVHNVGPLRLEESVSYYMAASCVFLPTLAEVFSATYVEAMVMRRPIVTTDLGFARSVCGDGALYFSPLDAGDAANILARLLTTPDMREGLIAAAEARASLFADSFTKHEELLSWLVSLE